MWNTIKYIVRSLIRKKTLSAITIGGYAISMAVIFLLVSFIIGEKSVNKSFPNYNEIYRITRNEHESNVPLTFLEDAKNKIPEFNKLALFSINTELYVFDKEKHNARFLATNDDFFDIFSFQFIYRNANSTIEKDNTLYLTQSVSRKLFGETNPVGEQIEINNELYQVSAVISDPPKNSSIQFDMVTDLNKTVSHTGIGYNEEEHKMFEAIALLPLGILPETVTPKIENMVSHWQAFKNDKLSLQPFSELYFDTRYQDDMQHANIYMIYLLSCIAVVILFMTIFNYINISVSSLFNRQNEIGIHKTTGASPGGMLTQFLLESSLVCTLAMGIAILLAIVFSPLFSEILDKEINLFEILSEPIIWLVCFLMFPIVGLISGSLPAIKAANITPIQVLQKKRLNSKNGGQLTFLVFQFFISIVLITSVLFINKQLSLVKNGDLGFDKEMLLRINLEGNIPGKWQVLKDKLISYPGIISVTATHGSPHAIYSSSSGSFASSTGEKVEIKNLKHLGADHDFLGTFNIKLIQGRNFGPHDENCCLINKKLADYLELQQGFNEKVFGKRIVGVIEDFHYENLYTKMGYLTVNTLNYPSTLSIKIAGDITTNLKHIKSCFNEIEPGTPCNIQFYNDWIASIYKREEKQAYAIKFFTFIAIIISCLGLFGIIRQMTFRKIKEIGVRKVNGARIIQVMGMVNQYTLLCIVAAFVIATPVTYLLMHKWLENFAYKTSLSWWIFALAGLMALGIALLTVSWQSWRAARRNPVESLKYE